MTQEYLPDPYRQFIHTSRYARWRDDLGRRETWAETVDRYVDFMAGHLYRETGYVVPSKDYDDVREAILNQDVGPSMRALMTAGPALERNNIAGYNCSYLPLDDPRAFDELLYILMNGTGVGYSVEKKYVKKLPTIPSQLRPTSITIVVQDSKEGWADAFRVLLGLLWLGQAPQGWDLSKVRPAGARLRTFGGRASGPAPLDELFRFTVAMFKGAAGRRLTTLEAHDLACKIASVVVVGGVRRSALISLSDLDDGRMAAAKSGQWWEDHDHRRLANNSVAYTCTPDMASFMSEWKNLYDSKSGERGIFNRDAAARQVSRNGRRDASHEWGTNPCSEIILRPYQFCNLSTVVVRADDTLYSLAEKVRVATILGTWQSTLINFQYLRPIWKQNTAQERLLGVSMTGQLGHPVLSGGEGLSRTADWLNTLRETAVATNAEHAALLGIPASAAITCVKPEGTSSQLFGVSSGMHPWDSPYYSRQVRGDKKDPLTQFLIDVGIPHEDEIYSPDSTAVFSFPIKSPDGAVTKHDLAAIDHLNLWLTWQRSWCEHKPSITVTVREHEWMAVGAWVFEHFSEVSGVSFLPASDHIYQQAPYQEIDKAAYERAVAAMPDSIRWEDLAFFESEDGTTGSQELACTAAGGEGCEVVDITPN